MHSFLFKSSMMRQLLANKKTQTRRIAPLYGSAWTHAHNLSYLDPDTGKHLTLPSHLTQAAEPGSTPQQVTTGDAPILPLDQFYAKETFYLDLAPYAYGGPLPKTPPDGALDHLYYAADAPDGDICKLIPECDCSAGSPKLRPSIFMPQWASRYTATVHSVKLERLQDITNEDAIAEGNYEETKFNRTPQTVYRWDPGKLTFTNPITAYLALWDSINAKPRPIKEGRGKNAKIIAYESFPAFRTSTTAYTGVITTAGIDSYRGKPLHIHTNPWVWAISFERNP